MAINTSVKPAYQKWKDLKNFVVLVTAIFLIVSANQPTSQLQSSLNIEDGMGTTSTGIGQGVSIVSFLLLPTIFTDIFGLKYTMVLGFTVESLSILANFYPAWYTLAPGAILSYSVSGLARACQCAYSTILVERYSENTGADKDKIISAMFGIYNTVSSFGFVVGNLISYNVLKHAEVDVNATKFIGYRYLCGPFFTDADHQDTGNFKRPAQRLIYILFGCLTLIGLLSAVTLLFLDSIPKSQCGIVGAKRYRRMVLETLTFNRNWRGALLWPSNFHRGLVMAFVFADITKAFSTCLIGMQSVGLFCMAYGASMTVFCICFGFLSKAFGRVPVFAISAVIEMSLLIFCLLWTPSVSHDTITVYLMAILFGVVVAGLTVNFHVLHGVLFPDKKEASFSNYMLAENTGSMVGNAYSSSLSMTTKVAIAMSALLVSAVSYSAIEISMALSKRRKDNNDVLEMVRTPGISVTSLKRKQVHFNELHDQ